MRLQFATETLFSSEQAPRFASSPQPYGRCIELAAFGWRLIVDLIR
ncbi:hypothetical protein [Cognatiluteimonas profundi]|nr:hypothetical protein [Lysobacter profundi]